MPILHMIDAQRDAAIDALLPKKSFIDRYVSPVLKKIMGDPLMRALKAELKLYRKFPKTGKYKPLEFDPRNNSTCFMGHGFDHNGNGMLEAWTSHDLKLYRGRIGTLPHKKWGNCTLLEIWGADHFKAYPDMVKAAYDYGWGQLNRMPKLQFHFLPFVIEAGTSNWERKQIDDDRDKYQDDMIDHLVEAKVANRLREERIKWRKAYKERSEWEEDDNED